MINICFVKLQKSLLSNCCYYMLGSLGRIPFKALMFVELSCVGGGLMKG